MSKFNKIIATAVLLVVVASNVKAAEAPVAAVTEAAAVATPASATEAAAANLVAGSTTAPVAGWTVKGKLGEAGKWISAKGEAAATTTKDFGTSSVTTIKNNPKTSAAVAVVVIAGVSYAIYKYNQSKAKKACNA